MLVHLIAMLLSQANPQISLFDLDSGSTTTWLVTPYDGGSPSQPGQPDNSDPVRSDRCRLRWHVTEKVLKGDTTFWNLNAEMTTRTDIGDAFWMGKLVTPGSTTVTRCTDDAILARTSTDSIVRWHRVFQGTCGWSLLDTTILLQGPSMDTLLELPASTAQRSIEFEVTDSTTSTTRSFYDVMRVETARYRNGVALDELHLTMRNWQGGLKSVHYLLVEHDGTEYRDLGFDTLFATSVSPRGTVGPVRVRLAGRDALRRWMEIQSNDAKLDLRSADGRGWNHANHLPSGLYHGILASRGNVVRVDLVVP